MYTLGLSCYYHDSALSLLKDGEIIACVQEERFSRKKNDARFPTKALDYLINEYSLSNDNLKDIIFYEKPFLKFERIIETIIYNAPKSLGFALKSLPEWLGSKLNLKATLKKEFKNFGLDQINILFSEHHFSHAAASFYTSPFADALCVTIDGVGEWSTASIIEFNSNNVKFLKEMHFPNSIGILYSAFTYFLGFKINSGEYKLMGLAPYGDINDEETKNFIEIIKNNFITIHDDGSIKLNLSYFKFHYANQTINKPKFESTLKLKKRNEESNINQSHCNLALAIQTITEEIILKIIRSAKLLTNSKNLCLAGGVALNCVANKKILDEGIFEDIWIHPNPGDAGASLGAALGYYYRNKPYLPGKHKFTPFLGPEFSALDIKRSLRRFDIGFKTYNQIDLINKVSDDLFNNKVVGWFQDRMEWGPRALGNRSILANPCSSDMQKKLNLKIKFRESFRPFAPIVLKEKASKIFNTHGKTSSFMQYTFPLVESRSPQIFELPIDQRIKDISIKLPAITHVDNSARIQTVSREENEKIYDLITAFESKSSFPVLINTSFNVRGEPIVCSPDDAIKCFLNTNMDILILDNFYITKNN